jgi:glycyl-tRNA synthetase beta chain
MSQLLIEIFSEEIPARMQQGGARDLERIASDAFKKAGLTWDSLVTHGGPRRLTLVVDGLPTATPDLNEELKGPKTSAPAQALEGFLRKTGLTQDQLTERDGVWFAEVSQKGRPTTEVVAETLEAIFRTMAWPKSQRWGSNSFRWVRPIHRIIALFDGAVIPYELDLGSTIGGVSKKIVASNVTEGHRFMGSGEPFEVKDFADYQAQLAANFVVLAYEDRKAKVLEGSKSVCAAKGLELVDDIGLLDEVAGLAEWPTPILGDMDPQFLALPPEVVRLSMKVHQKYFAVRQPAAEGLAPHYVVVANVEASDGGAALAAGNSKVLSARLSDGQFFWEEDQKVGFDVWTEKLSGVTFHAKLGTMAERVERIAALAREIAQVLKAQGADVDPDQAERAARLSKADLASGMVGEFPELQGIMGGYYARLAGEPDAIADAVRDHYKPQGPADSVPTAPLTVAVALADKIDTLAGFFTIDEKPTGSKDPFALRRAALGVIRLILDNNVRINLHHVINDHVQRLTGAGYLSTVETTESLLDFMKDRLVVSLRDAGTRHDVANAAFAKVGTTVVFFDQLVSRADALSAFLATDDGANLLAGYKRASNILRAEEKKGPLPTGMVQTGLANQPEAETQLAMAAAQAANAVDAALDTEDFAAAMTALAGLRGPVDAFFTDVMVNSDVAEERDNRLKLLGQVRTVMSKVADFGQVAG